MASEKRQSGIVKGAACIVTVASFLSLVGLAWSCMSIGASSAMIATLWQMGESFGAFALWNILFLVSGVAMLRGREWGRYLIIGCIPIRALFSLYCAGFRPLQFTWFVLFVAFALPPMPSRPVSMEGKAPPGVERSRFTWSGAWRFWIWLYIGGMWVGSVLVGLMIWMAMRPFAPGWFAAAPAGFVTIIGAAFWTFYPTSIEFVDERALIFYAFGKEYNLTEADIAGINPDRSLGAVFPPGAALRLKTGKELLIPPFFEDYDEMLRRLTRLADREGG